MYYESNVQLWPAELHCNSGSARPWSVMTFWSGLSSTSRSLAVPKPPLQEASKKQFVKPPLRSCFSLLFYGVNKETTPVGPTSPVPLCLCVGVAKKETSSTSIALDAPGIQMLIRLHSTVRCLDAPVFHPCEMSYYAPIHLWTSPVLDTPSPSQRFERMVAWCTDATQQCEMSR